ncbi:MAG: glycosyltransferase [Chitinophagales bacterium]|nr:glycosyltransferase [Chitinophagales bacterium]
MQKQIIFIKNSTCDHVRVLKFNSVFKNCDIHTTFLGWDRTPESQHHSRDKYDLVKYILHGGGYGKNILLIYYPIWILKIFIWDFFRKKQKGEVLIAIDFDSAFPLFLSKLFGSKSKYIYDIHDDFALRYKWSNIIKKIITFLDYKVKNGSLKTIHVDENRIRPKDKNYVILHNSPMDFHEVFNPPSYKLTLAAIGHLSPIRGLDSIITFAEKAPDISLIIVGKQLFSEATQKRIEACENISIFKQMPQEELFKIISDCSGIYSLYDASIEINKKAASNKLYDAMMLGIPVIVNREIEASEFVEAHNTGFIVSYSYDDSWHALNKQIRDINLIKDKGLNGRKLFQKKYNFTQNVMDKIVKPHLL